MRKFALGLLMASLVIAVAACGQSSDSRDRNAQSLAGKACSTPGQSKKVGKTLHICGAVAPGKMWFAAVSAQPKGAVCRKLGATRKVSGKTSVCGKVGKKQFWVAVQPLPASMVASVSSLPGETSASGSTIVETPSAIASPSTTAATSTPPSTIVVPNDEFKKTVAALSVPTRSVLTTPLTDATSGVVVSPAPAIQLVDEGGNVRGRAGVVVKVAVDNDDVVVSGGEATTNADGLAMFGKLTFTGAAGPLQVTFEPEGMASVNAKLELAPGAPSQMLLFGGATSVVAGAQWEPAPAVAVVDSAGNFTGREGDEVTVRIKGGKTLSKATIGKDNFAHFSLKAPEAAGDAVFEFVGPAGLEPATTTLTVASATADHIVIDSVLPSVISNGAPIADEVKVHIADRYGNLVKSTDTKVIMAISPYVLTRLDGVGAYLPAGAVINGEAAILRSGYATFTNPTVEGEAGDWVLTFATDEENAVQTFHEVKLVAGVAAALQLVTPPAGVRSGEAMATQPALRLVDKSGNAIAGKGTTITASVGTDYKIANAIATTDEDGVATFKDLTVSGPSKRIDVAFDSALMPTLSKTVFLAPGQISELKILDHSRSAVAGETFGTASKIGTVDASGNMVSQDATIFGRCTGSVDWIGVDTVDGVATFAGQSVTRAGVANCEYKYVTGADLLLAAQRVEVVAASETTVEILTQPPTKASMSRPLSIAPRARLIDRFGNAVSKAGVTVGIFTTNPSLIIQRSLVRTDASGIADFGETWFGGVVGSYRLSIGPAGGIAVQAQADTVVSAGIASQATIVRQLAGLASGVKATTQPTLAVTDVWGNRVAESGWVAQLKLTPTSLASQATKLLSLSGNSATSGADGVIAFSNVVVSGLSGVTYVPTFSVGTGDLESVQLSGNEVSLAPGMAAKFAVPSSLSVNSGASLGSVIQLDSKGNRVSNAGAGSVAVTLGSQSGVMWGNQMAPDTTVDGETTLGYRVFGTRGSTGQLTVSVGGGTPQVIPVSLASDAAVGDRAPSGGVIIGVSASSPRFVEIAPRRWLNGSFPVGDFSYAVNSASNAYIAGNSGWTLPTSTQLRAMTTMPDVVRATYDFYPNASVWSSTGSSSGKTVWNATVNALLLNFNVNYTAVVLPARSFG